MSILVDLIKSSQIDVNELSTLPKNLIKIVLNIFSKRGLLTDQNISIFLNEQTKLLELSECSKISDVGLDKISICKNLVKIDLNSNSAIRDLVTSDGIILNILAAVILFEKLIYKNKNKVFQIWLKIVATCKLFYYADAFL